MHMSQPRARITKLPVHDHLTHVSKSSLTGPENIGNLHIILKVIFHCIFVEIPCVFSKFVRIIIKSIAYCLTEFC